MAALAASAPSAPAAARRAREIHRRVIDRLVDRLRAQLASALTRKPGAQLMRHLLRAPALPQKLTDRVVQHTIAGQAPLTRPPHPCDRRALSGMRPIATMLVTVAAQLAADRGRRTAELPGDRAHALTRPEQISDPDPLIRRQIPLTANFLLNSLHRRIVPFPPDGIPDRPPVTPPNTGLAMHTNLSARLAVTRPRSDQRRPSSPLLSLRRRSRRPLLSWHRNPQTVVVLRRSLESTPSHWGQLRPAFSRATCASSRSASTTALAVTGS